jgi:outer membrane receptor for ferric coprogen and ferric-rhodotorulic acid
MIKVRSLHPPRSRLVIKYRPALSICCASMTMSAIAQIAPPVPAADMSQPASGSDSTLAPVTVTGRRTDDYTVKDSAAATKLTLTPRETPQSMTVITRERLDDQATTSLRQVLDNTPGIYSSAFDTERVVFYSRGFLIDTLMYDGVPALSSFDTSSIDETLDSALYERIEVVRGATGLMTGAGSPAASINLVRKHADSRTPTYSFDLTAGSWRDRRAEFDVSTPLNSDGTIRGRVVGVAEDTHSYQGCTARSTTRCLESSMPTSARRLACRSASTIRTVSRAR